MPKKRGTKKRGTKKRRPIAALRLVKLTAGRMRQREEGPRSVRGGIVAKPSARFVRPTPLKVRTADSLFPPIIPVPIAVSNGGGAIGTGLPVQLIFWGNAWNQAATSPSAGAVVSAVQNILRGPWMSGLRQYGIGRCIRRPGWASRAGSRGNGGLLLRRIRQSGGDQQRQFGRTHSLGNLQALCRSRPLLEMDFVEHPLAKK